ncbi:hypothetical protein Csa_008512 [Cucumis sativus]|uniref:Uncharacterized protein n=1 Tax=Cucumis sativus TaxID=3659 RepID=A0A0A0KTF1_CUCSA|nr:hypothetical protein Csa_008512 [Cucumis sativus]
MVLEITFCFSDLVILTSALRFSSSSSTGNLPVEDYHHPCTQFRTFDLCRSYAFCVRQFMLCSVPSLSLIFYELVGLTTLIDVLFFTSIALWES